MIRLVRLDSLVSYGELENENSVNYLSLPSKNLWEEYYTSYSNTNLSHFSSLLNEDKN